MSEEKMREEFEAWAAHHGYDLTRDDVVVAYASEETDRAWWAWQASRAALVVELPTLPPKGTIPYAERKGASDMHSKFRLAIASAGVRVKRVEDEVKQESGNE